MLLPKVMKSVDENAAWLVERGSTKQVSLLLWSYATLGHPCPKLMQAVTEQASTFLAKANTYDISILAWSFATLACNNNINDSVSASGARALLREIDTNHATRIVYEGSTQDIANTAWAFGKLLPSSSSSPPPALFSLMNESASKIVSLGKTHEISNVMWAFATLDIPAGKLIKEIDGCADDVLTQDSASPQAVSNIAWSIATLSGAAARNPAPNVFSQIDIRAQLLLASGNSQDLSNALWAFATLGRPSPALFKLAKSRAGYLARVGTAQELSNLAWAFASLNVPAYTLFEMINKKASMLVKSGTTQTISNAVWSFGRLQYDGEELFAAVDADAERLIGEGTAQEVSNTAVAFAILNQSAGNFFDVLEKHVDAFLEKSASEQAVTNVLWSLAVLDQLQSREETLVRKLWERSMLTPPKGLSSDALVQLVQVEAYARAHSVELGEVPPQLRERMESVAKSVKSHSSESGKAYSTLLRSMGFKHESEVSPFEDGKGSLMAIDLACRERKIAVEYDGRVHYLSSGKENGKTVAKRKMLERLGWSVVNIKFTDEMFLAGMLKDREKKPDMSSPAQPALPQEQMTQAKKIYLRKKMAEVGITLNV
jgi:very-short-patch-repair endonuclease